MIEKNKKEIKLYQFNNLKKRNIFFYDRGDLLFFWKYPSQLIKNYRVGLSISFLIRL